ncbi:hypothetical protein [Herbaspirillum sp.]|uniref:hypothetical protein n=1 Tax=Herbaspirillum sp. TaxID=1890675 RepID=UPI0031D0314E
MQDGTDGHAQQRSAGASKTRARQEIFVYDEFQAVDDSRGCLREKLHAVARGWQSGKPGDSVSVNGPCGEQPPGRREQIVSSVSDSSYDTVKCLGDAGAFFYGQSGFLVA